VPRPARKSVRLLLPVLLILITAIPAWSGTSVLLGTDPTKFVLKGKLAIPEQVVDGKLVIEGNTITCAGSACDDPPGATVLTVTDAYIFPGFIDAHNHVVYNVFPKWTPPKLYQNRGQWQRSTSYKEFKKPYNNLKKNLYCEMVKYGEIKALLSGVTTIQGTSPDRKCIRTLVRNAENQNELSVPGAHIRTYILDIKSFKGKIDTSVTKTFVVHIGEGVDEISRKEFDTLKHKGLLTKETAIIHGTAFGEAEFDQMAQVGANLIWSPQSNLALYDKTTDIKLALSKGCRCHLASTGTPPAAIPCSMNCGLHTR
jgi:cytosine/adenosine deaminase-related metal-dependent hydrolase